MTCLHKHKRIERAAPYVHHPAIKRREYVCDDCNTRVTTYEGTIEALQAWQVPQARKELLKEVFSTINAIKP